MLFYGALNDGFDGVASGVVVLRVEYPGANRGRLIGQRVEAIGRDDDFLYRLFGLESEVGSRVDAALRGWQQHLRRLVVLRSLWIFSGLIC